MFSSQGGVAKLNELVGRWEAEPGKAACLVAKRTLMPREACFADLPEGLTPRLSEALWRRGMPRLYQHQARAYQLARAGRDYVIATPTASGKTIGYNLPVFDTLLRDSKATALYLFPTKALARDQVEEAETLARATGANLPIAVYDGDTPPGVRRVARARARIIATNPDMLHAALLPHQARWARFFAGLRYVVVDEVHSCRGMFGSHIANVLRRLRRIAAFHGARPQLIGASATIGNPGEHASRLFGSPTEVVSSSGAPSGQRKVYVYNPPVLNPSLGVRASAVEAACRLVRELHEAGSSTIVFVRTRTQVEVIVRALKDAGISDVRGYRAGYLPERRRSIERDLRAGRTKTVVATSALELGIDIGSLDACVVVGWPGSRAGFWQRAGRAGRRQAPSVAILVARNSPTDQFAASQSSWLFDESVESARIAPDNPAVLLEHVQCAAFELPFVTGESFGPLRGETLEQALALLEKEGRLIRADGRWQWIGQTYPAADVPLRGPVEENFLVVDEERGSVIAEVDYRDAPKLLHEGAIHGIEGAMHEVRRLDWEGQKAYVRRVDVDFYTQAISNREVRRLQVHEESGCATFGEIHVAERVIGFKKIKLGSHQNVGYGDVQLPDQQMHTTACWWRISGHGLSGPDVGAGAEAAAHSLRHGAALMLMSDAADFGVAIEDVEADAPATGTGARIFVYDSIPGGAGLAEGVFERRDELVARALAALGRCDCKEGCPICSGSAGHKQHGRTMLQCLQSA